ncbi:alpha-(1,6)-fucosyltransferase-like isoform X2 [Mercenaria mercenaria]|uniref:alpha-(1,6)-fucosyltransferase-like isoform X2 n=1 Tax=Mercenaria mercenaria TaxID=6596 RepID=UPI00234E7675|nr:alpha-(1,6)-fucosyltransferase-like isoform X2 [Mercenaria mercenaria]
MINVYIFIVRGYNTPTFFNLRKIFLNMIRFGKHFPVFVLFLLLLVICVFFVYDRISRQNIERELYRAVTDLETIQEQNAELLTIVSETTKKLQACQEGAQKLSLDLDRATEMMEKMKRKANDNHPSLKEEIARREVGRSTIEFLRYIYNIISKHQHLVKEKEGVLNDILEFQKKFRSDMNRLADGHGEWRKEESHRLGLLVQRRLNYLQSPKECKSVKKLVCKVNNGCGFGCKVHHITACLIMAYATRRTLILESKANSIEVDNAEVVEMASIESMSRPSYFPLAVPEDLADRILHFHGDPAVWWIGQFVKYITRPNEKMNEYLNTKRMRLRFTTPIVGVQIRRTDKIGQEAQMHLIEEYMTHVKEWYDVYEKKDPGVRRRVYIASDDPKVFAEAVEKYPQYIFISDKNASISAALKTRHSEESLRGIILDIHMLSLCDYLVCTFSSQVCRAAYELMQTRHGDASQWFKSLDDLYYFGGQNMHRWRMIEQHQNDSLNEGDIIKIHGNLWNGFSEGQNLRLNKAVLFPSYKAVDIVERANMPTYTEVPEI